METLPLVLGHLTKLFLGNNLLRILTSVGLTHWGELVYQLSPQTPGWMEAMGTPPSLTIRTYPLKQMFFKYVPNIYFVDTKRIGFYIDICIF